MADYAFNFWREKERESHSSSRLEKVTADGATHASSNTTKPATAAQTNSTAPASDGSLKFPAAASQGTRSDSVKPPHPPNPPPYKPSHVLQAELERGKAKQTSGVVLDGPPKWFESGVSSRLVHRGSKPTLDDADLNRPKRRQVSTWAQGTHVSQLAERLNLMLSPAPPLLPHRHSDPSSTHSSQPNPRRAHSAKLISKLISGDAVKEEEEEGADSKVPRWRSFSGSRGKSSSSVKIRSSGFICYLDGPEERARGDSFCEGHAHKVSATLQSVD